MFLAHAFRLRDPWQCEAAEDGALRWTRVFHRPTGLEPDDQLVLVISGLPPDANVTVNRHEVGATGVSPVPEAGTRSLTQFNLTAILADSNLIELLIPPTADSPQPTTSSHSFPYDARLAIVAAS
jgi:hypothetical protein